jgi:serine protease Do
MLGARGGHSSETQKKEKMGKSGWIGVMVQDVNEKIAGKAKLDSEEGAYVVEIVEDSPADSGGIGEGDVIVELNGKKVFDSDDLVKMIQKTEPGTKVSITVIHNGEKKKTEITVGKKKRSKHSMFGMMPTVPDIRVFVGNKLLGLRLITLNEQLGEYFSVPNNEGVLVEEVEKESTADKAGFKAGDIITRIGKRTINKVEKVRRELEKYDEGEKVEFEIIRKGTKKSLSVEIEEDQSIQQNFFYHTPPNIHKFHFDPFDDAEMNLEMDDLQPKLDHLQIELEHKMKNVESKWKDIQKQVQQFAPLQVKTVCL